MNGQNTRNIGHLPLGERVLIGHRTDLYGGRQYFQFPAYSICTVEGHDPSTGKTTLRKADGTTVAVDQKSGTIQGSRDTLLWTDLLPTGSDEQVIAYCKAIGGSEDRNDATNRGILLHVERIEGGVTYARPVFPAGSIASTDPDAWDADPWKGTVVGNAAFFPAEVMVVTHVDGEPEIVDGIAGPITTGRRLRVEVPVEAKAGDLLAAPFFKFTLDGDRLRAEIDHPVTVGSFPTRDALGAFLPWGARPAGWDDQHPAGFFTRANDTQAANDTDLHMEVARAHARAEPDEALVLWYKAAGDNARDISYAVLGKSGIVFHEIDNAEDYLYGWNVEPGLWVVEDAKFWSHYSYEGEYDCGLDGSIRPATPEDVERFGYSMEDLDEEIVAATDGECLAEGDLEQGVAERYRQLAVIADGGAPEMAAPAA